MEFQTDYLVLQETRAPTHTIIFSLVKVGSRNVGPSPSFLIVEKPITGRPIKE